MLNNVATEFLFRAAVLSELGSGLPARHDTLTRRIFIHVERAALLLDHDQGLPIAALGLALYPMAPGNVLWQGSRRSGRE
jgi:hypothetical protein